MEFWVNGVSLGVRESAGVDRIFQWQNVTLTVGENEVVARAQRGGATLEGRCSWLLQKPDVK